MQGCVMENSIPVIRRPNFGSIYLHPQKKILVVLEPYMGFLSKEVATNSLVRGRYAWSYFRQLEGLSDRKIRIT